MGANLKLVHRFFVDVGRAIDGELFHQGWQRDRPRDPGPSPLRGFDDVNGGLIEHSMIECLQTNTDALGVGHITSSPSGRGRPRRAVVGLVRNGTAPLSNWNGPWRANEWRLRNRTFRRAAPLHSRS